MYLMPVNHSFKILEVVNFMLCIFYHNKNYP